MKNVALITGSYGGLGTCFVDIHAGKGGDLILVGRSEEKLKEQAQAVEEKYHVTAQYIAADLSAADAAQKIYDTCKENQWMVDYLINNAGFGGQGDFTRERSMEQDMSMIAVNIETPTRLMKLFLPDMVSRGSGKVLNARTIAGSILCHKSLSLQCFQCYLERVKGYRGYSNRFNAGGYANRFCTGRGAFRHQIICQCSRTESGSLRWLQWHA